MTNMCEVVDNHLNLQRNLRIYIFAYTNIIILHFDRRCWICPLKIICVRNNIQRFLICLFFLLMGTTTARVTLRLGLKTGTLFSFKWNIAFAIFQDLPRTLQENSFFFKTSLKKKTFSFYTFFQRRSNLRTDPTN